MNIIAKSSFHKENILDKINKGCDGIEIQLFDLNESCLDENYKIDNFFKNYNIVAIHTPLDLTNDFNFDIETPRGKQALTKTLNLAEKFSQFYGKQIDVICHMGLSIRTQKELEIYEQNKEFLINQLNNFKDININLENVTIRLINPFDNVDLVKEINLKNFKTTFDVCHALITQKVLENITYNCKDERYKYFTFDEMLEINSGVCNWIHLNNAKDLGSGYGRGKGHGVIFEENKKDIEILTKTLNFAVQENLKNICIEVREDDYLNCQNFLKMKELCKKYI